jgi:hypothetical protein
MRLKVSNLDDERMRAVRLAGNDQLRHHDSVVGGLSKGTNPPFGCRQVRRVDNERLIRRIPSSGGFQTPNVGSVTQLRLGIAPNVLVGLGRLKEELVLLGRSLIPDRFLTQIDKPLMQVQQGKEKV